MRLTWFNRHRRYRDDLSAGIDGELPPRRAADLEAHLSACPGCRRELAELRATALMLRELPQVAPPRSFALTPEQAGRPAGRRTATGLPAMIAGLRLAGAGLAVALAVVLVADLGGSADDGRQPATVPGALQLQTGAKAADSFADRAASPPEAGNASGQESVESGTAGGGGTLGQGVNPTPLPPPPGVVGLPATAPALPPPGAQDVTNGSAAETPSALSNPPAAAQSGGGTDVLRVVEIGLAVAAAFAVAGSFLLARARRDLP